MRTLARIVGLAVVLGGCDTSRNNYVEPDGGSIDAAPTDGVVDTAPPQVVARTPADGENDVAPTTAITVTFSEEIDAETITSATFLVEDGDGNVIDGTLDVVGAEASFTPAPPLDPAMDYVVTLTTAIQDLAGNALPDAEEWTFATRAGGWSSPGLLETDQNAAASDLDVAARGTRAVAVWIMRACAGSICGGEYSLVASRYEAGVWSSPSTVASSASVIARPKVALDDAGNATVVWYQGTGSVTSIFASRHEGAAWSEPQNIDPKDLGNATAPALAVDDAGNVTAAWLQTDGTTPGAITNVWAARFTTAGGWGNPGKIEEMGTNASTVRVAAGAGGTAIVVFSQGSTVYAARYAGSWISPVPIGSGSPTCADLVMAPDASAIAMWSVGSDLMAARYTGTWSPAAAIDAESTSIEAGCDLDAGPDGRVIAVWVQGGNASQAVFTSAAGWGSAFNLESGSGDVNTPSVSAGSAMRAMAVWSQHDGSIYNAWANHYRSSTGWAGPALVETQGGSVTGASKVIYDAGTNTFIALWLQAPTGFHSVYASSYE